MSDLLLKRGAKTDTVKLNRLDYTLLQFAAATAKEEKIIDSLIESGAEIEATNSLGYTALAIAVEKVNNAMVQILIAKGADVSTTCHQGSTLLHSAVFCIYKRNSGSSEVLATLLNYHAKLNLNAQGISGETALLHAAIFGQQETVKQLLELDACPRTTNNDGTFPLMGACDNGHTEIIEHLLEKLTKSDIERFNERQKNAIAIAYANRNLVVIKMLLEKGATLTHDHFCWLVGQKMFRIPAPHDLR